MVVGLATGFRPGELLGLLWQNVDLEAATVEVTGSMKRTARPEGGYALALGAVKRSKNGKRTVALGPSAVEALRPHTGRQADESMKAGEDWSEQGLVFCDPPGRPLDHTHVRRVLDRIAKKAGLEGGNTYLLRHMVVSLFLDAGKSIEDVADLLGDDPRTLYRHYRHKVRPVADAGLAMESVFSR